MLRSIRMAYGAALVIVLSLSTSAAFGDEVSSPPNPAPQEAASVQVKPVESPPVESTTNPPNQDTRALSPEEVQNYQTQSDSLTQSGQLQDMNVGASIDGTIVLSVLVALLIFVILVEVL